MEPEVSLPHSQVPATRPYPEPAPSANWHTHIKCTKKNTIFDTNEFPQLWVNDHLNVQLSYTVRLVLQSSTLFKYTSNTT